MKTYTAARSLYGDLGSLRRNQILNGDDPRIVNNPKAVKQLVASNMLIEGVATEMKPETAKSPPPKGKPRSEASDD